MIIIITPLDTQYVSVCFHSIYRRKKLPRTLRMRRMAAMPDVAMTLALLGTRLRRIGMMASAAWSKRLPSTDDRWLTTGEQRDTQVCFNYMSNKNCAIWNNVMH